MPLFHKTLFTKSSNQPVVDCKQLQQGFWDKDFNRELNQCKYQVYWLLGKAVTRNWHSSYKLKDKQGKKKDSGRRKIVYSGEQYL